MAAGPPLGDSADEEKRLELIACYRDRLMMDRDEAQYVRYFESRAGERPIMCEITPSYSLLNRDGFARMAAIHPNVKFVFIIRNPVDRFWSQVRFAASFGATGTMDRLIDRSVTDPQVVLRTRYDRTIAALRDEVPPDRILIEFYERLFGDDAIARFCAFAGITFRPGDYASQVNASRPGKLTPADRRRIYKVLAPVYDWARDEFAGNLPDSWRADMAAHG
jgi:hypothetical protein